MARSLMLCEVLVAILGVQAAAIDLDTQRVSANLHNQIKQPKPEETVPSVGSSCTTLVPKAIASTLAPDHATLEAYFEGLDGSMPKTHPDDTLIRQVANGSLGESSVAEDPSPCKYGEEGSYGEITPGGLEQLLKEPLVAWSAAHPEERIVDLGAGLGKLGFGAVLRHGARSSVGVELSGHRFGSACTALRGLQTAVEAQSTGQLEDTVSITMQREDMMKTTALSEATLVIWNNLCFRQSFTNRVAEVLRERLPIGARILNSKQLPKGTQAGRRLRKLDQLPLRLSSEHVTWGAGCNMHVHVVEQVNDDEL